MFAKKFLWEGMHDILYRLHMLTDVACLSPCRRITVTSYFLQRAGGSDKREKSVSMCAWQVCAVVQSLEVTAQMIETCHSFMLEPYWSIYLHQSEPRRLAIYCLRYRNSGCPTCRQSAPWQMDRDGQGISPARRNSIWLRNRKRNILCCYVLYIRK